MSSNVTCPNPSCGKAYQVSVEHLGRRGRCKSCGTEFVFAETKNGEPSAGDSVAENAAKTGSSAGTTRVGRTQTPARLGRFQIQERVGMGGFGAVYRAQDPQLQRTVALKLLQSTGDDQRDQHRINRFLVEGRAGARLQHPNIVPVFDAGKDEETGEYYMAAAFITGQPLSSAIDSQPMDLRRAATIVVQLARALEYAHTQGILHRDVKPDNVMLDEKDVPHLMDFGLARMEESESHLTRDGAVMGTPSYMSPEQCVGKQDALGPAADQYSLGCLFYELLTGDKLFSGPVSVQIHHQINTEAPAPSTKNKLIPQDLDTICLKMLTKEPDRRYGSCAELAADLDHWLADEPILARKLTTWERWQRWRKRNPAIAGLSLGLASALLIGLLGVTTQWLRAEQNASAARLATMEQTKATEAAEKAEQQARQTAAANKRIAYSAHMNLLQQAWDEADIAFMHDLLDRYLPEPGGQDLRCFEWYYWWRMSHGFLRQFEVPGSQIGRVEFSPNGKVIATASNDQLIRLWNAETSILETTLSGHGSDILCLAFSPDGRQLASGASNGHVIVWDLQTKQLSKTYQTDGEKVGAVSFAADNETLFIASRQIIAWNLVSDERRVTGHDISFLAGFTNGVAVAFSPDHKKLVTGDDSAAKIWDVETGQPLRALGDQSDRTYSAAFSPDGKLVLTGNQNYSVDLWDVESGIKKSTWPGHTNDIFSVTFSPDGRRAASTGRDLTIRLWDTETGQSLDVLKGHSGRIKTIDFSPDGTLLASAGRDYQVTLWDLGSRRPAADLWKHESPVYSVAFTNDSRFVASASGNLQNAADESLVRIRNVADAMEVLSLHHTGHAKAVAFSPDGDTLATGSTDNQVRIWNRHTGDLKHILAAPCDRGLSFLIRGLTFSPNGKLLATNGDAGSVNLWNPSSGEKAGNLTGDGHDATGMDVSPDGKLLAAGSLDFSVRVWEVDTGRRIHTLPGHKEYVWTVAFSKDGTTLASAGMDTTIKLWDVNTGDLKMNLTGHTDTVTWLAYSPDGKTLATTAGDKTVKLWDAMTGDLKTTLTGHTAYNYCVAFSPDGKTLASGSLDKTARLWRTASDADLDAWRGN